YIIAQRLLRTTDGKRQAVREYLVFDDDVREALGRLDHTRWRDWIDNHLSERKARMSDKAWALYQQGRISQHELLTVITRRELERRMSM
ncbi:MAG: plasmid transfer ATPase TraJ, partial [Pedobacter sp.]